MGLYAAKLKANAKPVSDLPPVDKKEAAKLKRQEKALLKKQEKEKEQAELKRQEDEAKKALADKEAELKAAEEALIKKKEAQKEKRKLKRAAKTTKVAESVSESLPSVESTPTASTETTLTEETKPVKKTRKRKQVSIDEQVDKAIQELPTDKKEMEPPAWFKKYVAGVKNEESQHRSPKKAKRVIAKEANQVATEQWGNGYVRDRVRNEVDQHMSRMYQMIFNRGF